MKGLKPKFFEYSRVPSILSKFAPININAITLFCFVFSKGKLSERTKRHETIHFQQYLETFVIGFLLIYLFDFLWAACISGKGFSRESYLAIRFEQEAWTMDKDEQYLETRSRFSWLHYPLGGTKK
jgi:hypothetical protein